MPAEFSDIDFDDCHALPIAINVCAPSWDEPSQIRILEWGSKLTVGIEPRFADRVCPECPEDMSAQLEQARATVSHLRGEVRECRRELDQAMVDPQAAGFGFAIALIAFGAWRYVR